MRFLFLAGALFLASQGGSFALIVACVLASTIAIDMVLSTLIIRGQQRVLQLYAKEINDRRSRR